MYTHSFVQKSQYMFNFMIYIISSKQAVPTLEDLGLQDLGKDIRLADLSCIVRQMTDTTPVPPQTSTWLSMYTSADTFFENKHG